MITLLLIIAILFALTLGIMYLVGLFNKRTAGHVKTTFDFIREVEFSQKNFRRLTIRIPSLIKVLGRRQKLLIIKIEKRLKFNRERRQERRREKKEKQQVKKQEKTAARAEP